MKSQNGWPASSDKTAIGIVPLTVAGASFPQGVKAGDVATVLGHLAEQFHATVEKLVPGHCWGYAFKRIEGSDDYSNHASGTALDLNAPAHPMGRRGTFSAAEVKAIRAILADLDGVVRWGGDYSGRPDEMHFEVVGNEAAVAKVAAKIRGGSSAPTKPPAPPASWTESIVKNLPTLRLGDGNRRAVLVMQSLVNTQGGGLVEDGVFGPKTDAAVRTWQARHRVPNSVDKAGRGDGIFGRACWTYALKM